MVDAEGITQFIMLLPGKAAAIARQSTAHVVVRDLGGDLYLVRDIMANRNKHAQLEPEHPARICGQCVRQGPKPYDMKLPEIQGCNDWMQHIIACKQSARLHNTGCRQKRKRQLMTGCHPQVTPHNNTLMQPPFSRSRRAQTNMSAVLQDRRAMM